MLVVEIRRRFKTKAFILSLVIVSLLTIILNISFIQDREYIGKMDQNEYIVTEDSLLEALEKAKLEGDSYKRETEIIKSLVYSYPGILYRENNIDNMPLEYANNFYSLYKNKFSSITDLYRIDKENSKREIDKIEIPFSHYNGVYIYNLLFSNLEKLYILIMFLVAFFAAESYAGSREDGSFEIIKSSKFYKKNMYLRFIPNILYGLILSSLVTLITLGFGIYIAGFDSLKSSFQMINLFNYGNIKISTGLILMFLSVNIGILAISLISSLSSLLIKKTSDTIIFLSILNIGYMILERIISKGPISIILKYIPIAAAYGFTNLMSLDFIYNVRVFYWIMINLVVLSIFTLTILLRRIKKM